jgi:hypothetical protein
VSVEHGWSIMAIGENLNLGGKTKKTYEKIMDR